MIKVLYYLAPVVIIGSLIYQIVLNLGTFKQTKAIEQHFTHCKYMKQHTPGPEDMTRYNETTLIFAHGDLMKVLGMGWPQSARPGAIYAIFNAAQDNFDVKLIPIIGFPQHVSMTPHGIYLKQFPDAKYLYVINHAYGRGGERIECLKFHDNDTQLLLEYEYSIIMPTKYMGIMNDLLVLNQSNLLVTVPSHYPHPRTGLKDMDFFSSFKSAIMVVLQYKKTFVHSCSFKPTKGKDVMPECTLLPQTASVFANGITRDQDDQVWVADTIGQKLRRFRYTPSDSQVLEFVEEIATDGGLDNLDYDLYANKIYGASIYRLKDSLKLKQEATENGGVVDQNLKMTYWAQADEIDLNPASPNFRKVIPLFRSMYANKGTSMAYKMGDKLYLSSFADASMMVCEKPKPRDLFD